MIKKISLALFVCFNLALVKGGVMPAAAATAHDFTFYNIDGGDLSLAEFKGKVVLLVHSPI